MRYADFGSISSGTMRSEDLLESLASELDFQISRQPRLFRRAPYRKLIREAHQCLRRLNGEGTRAQQQEAEEYASEIVNDLMDSLTEFAPPLAYFGSHPGDGALTGCRLTTLTTSRATIVAKCCTLTTMATQRFTLLCREASSKRFGVSSNSHLNLVTP
jgi:histone H3/H4